MRPIGSVMHFIQTNRTSIIFLFCGFSITMFLYSVHHTNIVAERKGPTFIALNDTILNFKSALDSSRTLRDVLSKSKKEYRVISLINASCGDCITELQAWQPIVDVLDSTSILFVFIGYDTSYDLLQYNAFTLANFHYDIFFDENNYFLSVNSSFYKTFLIDQNNQILVWGSPVKNRTLLQQYLRYSQN